MPWQVEPTDADTSARLIGMTSRAVRTFPLVVLIGSVGTGKTRLARRAVGSAGYTTSDTTIDDLARRLAALRPGLVLLLDELSSQTARQKLSCLPTWEHEERASRVVATYDAQNQVSVDRLLDDLESRAVFIPVPENVSAEETTSPSSGTSLSTEPGQAERTAAALEADPGLTLAEKARAIRYLRECAPDPRQTCLRNRRAEAYLLAAAPRLARLDRKRLDRLEQAVVNRGALAPGDFDWLRHMLSGFRCAARA